MPVRQKRDEGAAICASGNSAPVASPKLLFGSCSNALPCSNRRNGQGDGAIYTVAGQASLALAEDQF